VIRTMRKTKFVLLQFEKVIKSLHHAHKTCHTQF
jgi:hypothetical protein